MRAGSIVLGVTGFGVVGGDGRPEIGHVGLRSWWPIVLISAVMESTDEDHRGCFAQ